MRQSINPSLKFILAHSTAYHIPAIHLMIVEIFFLFVLIPTSGLSSHISCDRKTLSSFFKVPESNLIES